MQEDRVAHLGPRLHDDSGRQHRALHAAGDVAAGRDLAAGDPRLGFDAGRQALRAGGEDRPGGIVEPQRGLGRQEIHVRLPVAVDGADVLPVPLQTEIENAPFRHQPGEQLVAEVLEARSVLLRLPAVLFGQAVQGVEELAGVVGEDFGGHQVVPGRFGLVFEAGHPPLAVDLDDPEAARLLARHAGADQRQVRFQLPVAVEQEAVVELVDVVGAEDEEDVGIELADQRALPVERVGVPLGEAPLLLAVLALIGREDLEPAVGAVEVPGAAVRQVLVERVQLVLLDHPDVRDAAVHAVAQRDVDQPVDAGERHHRLGPLAGQYLEAAARAAGQDQGQDLLSRHLPSPLPPIPSPARRQEMQGVGHSAR